MPLVSVQQQMTAFLRVSTFQRQLSITVTVGILFLALASFLVSSWQGTNRVRRGLLEEGGRITENLARQSVLALLTAAPENAAEAVKATLAFPGVLRVEIRDPVGRLLLAQGQTVAELPPQTFTPSIDAPAILEAESTAAWRFVAPAHAQPDAESADSPFHLTATKRELLGQVAVVVSKAAMTQLTQDLFWANLITSFSFALLFLALIRWLTRHMTRPLDRLSAAMARAETGETNVRAPLAGPKDIAAMAQAFNTMISALEDREAQLRAARDEALAFARLKASFAATVSHEVRTPMNGVIGMLDLLKVAKLPRKEREFVDIAWSSAHTLLSTINDILDFSKLDARKMHVDSQAFDPCQVVEDVLELFAMQAHQTGLELGYLTEAPCPAQVQGDAKRFRQVITNLVGNALKFTECGAVSVRITPQAAAPDAAPVWRFTVCDTGIGISSAAQTHLFESFTQADPSTTRKFGGTGLGLAISRQLVTLMGGDIGVTSIPGQGSQFWFTLPLPPSVVPEEAALPALSVLVADPSANVRAFLSQTLHAWGSRPHPTDTLQEALQALQAAAARGAAFDLAILDANFALAEGRELAQRVRNDAVLAGTAILIMDKFGVDAQATALWGMHNTLAKPLRRDRLRACLSAIFQPQTVPPADSTHLRVLVVEDNRANQAVALGMLNALGYPSTVASNGAEALNILQQQPVDLVLMDCNMPVMDGCETTAHIRTLEKATGAHTPIIAMTANILPPEVQQCLATGMDDHLGKPLTLDALAAKLAHWLGQPLHPPHTSQPAASPHPALPIDQAVLAQLREILGDRLDQAIQLFLEDTPGYLAQLDASLEHGDGVGVRQIVHTLKGSAGSLGALKLAALARQVEMQADAAAFAEAEILLRALKVEYAEVHAAFSAEIKRPMPISAQRQEGSALVLVVDDDRSTRAALSYALQREGFRVQEACDGQAALALMHEIDPDVVLMDALMPVMDGFTACAKLHEMFNGADTPVLMITSLDDTESISCAFAAGASDYITKPLNLAVVSQRVRRIVEARRTERHVRHLAYNDTLTGLANRVTFMNRLGQQIAQGQPLAVLFLDLDRFKLVNDTLGHDVGDRLLVAVAQRIQHCVRGNDCAARFGGDEFTLILNDLASPEAASLAAEKICRALAAPFEIDGHDIFVSTSIGISLYPIDGTDENALLKHADTAMYRAKKRSTGYAFYESDMEVFLSGRLRLESALRRALERDELVVYYQPKAELAHGTLVGMEALVRWHHPQRGLVPPNEFIPLAEETGLILPIGQWVLQMACAQAKAWNTPGQFPLPVAVNLSGIQLKQAGIVQCVAGVLAATGLSPALLELEITESVLMEQANETLNTLKQLKALGVSLAIDDFGTGYSSLAYLKRFPVDTLKIDYTFVRDILTDPDDAAIVTGIIALVHSLRRTVVAEGVEMPQQRDFLAQAGCDQIQGYLLAEPLPAGQFEARLLMPRLRASER